MNIQLHRMLALLLALVILLLTATVAHADNGITDVPPLHGIGPTGENELDGGGHYMSNRYKNNYHLDIEELGIMDMIPGAGNFLANAIFTMDRLLVEAAAVVFYHCNTFQLADLLQEQMNGIQRSVKDQIFDILLPFAVIALGVFMVQALIRHNGQAIIGQAVSFFSVMLLATLLTTQTAAVVGAIDDLTMGVTQQLVNAVYGMGTGETGDQRPTDYATDVAGAMWETLIHLPWVTLNLDGDESHAEELLILQPNSEDRENIIERQVEKPDNTLFTKDKSGGQLGLLLVYTVPLLAKCGIYVCIGGLQLAFRVFTVIIALFGIVVLFLALIPQLGGSRLVGSWARKLLGIQLNIIVLSLVLSIIMLVDRLLYATGMGWIIIIILQAILCLIIFLGRDKILDFSKTISRSVSAPRLMMHNLERGLNNSDNAIYNSERIIRKGARAAIDNTQQTRGYIHARNVGFNTSVERWGGSGTDSFKVAQPTKRNYHSNRLITVSGTVAATPSLVAPRPRLYTSVQQAQQTDVTGPTAAQPVILPSTSSLSSASFKQADFPEPTAITAHSQHYRVYSNNSPAPPMSQAERTPEAVRLSTPSHSIGIQSKVATAAAPHRYRAAIYNNRVPTQAETVPGTSHAAQLRPQAVRLSASTPRNATVAAKVTPLRPIVVPISKRQEPVNTPEAHQRPTMVPSGRMAASVDVSESRKRPTATPAAPHIERTQSSARVARDNAPRRTHYIAPQTTSTEPLAVKATTNARKPPEHIRTTPRAMQNSAAPVRRTYTKATVPVNKKRPIAVTQHKKA